MPTLSQVVYVMWLNI